MSRFQIRRLFFVISSLALIILAVQRLPLQAADELTAKVDQLFSEWNTKTSPGCTLAVIRDGRIIYERGYGMARLEDDIPLTPDKIFDIGSVSKQFTAACVVLLAEDGQISLDDDVRKYIPGLPRYESPITIRHLIHHTSGLRDYNGLLEFAGFRPESDCPNVDEALDIVCRQKRLNYPPGQEFLYTNTGYFLLGQIVEKVSGRTLNEFAQQRIFRPLGMLHTLYQDDHLQVIKNRATGYDRAGKGFRLDMSNWDETGDGNVYTSVEDLFLWDQAFDNGKLGRGLMDSLQVVGTLNDGTKLDYAFGLRIGEYKGLKCVSHGGAWAGFRAAITRFPSERFTVICLANLSDIDPDGLSCRVADIYLAGRLKEPEKIQVKIPATYPVPQRDLEALAGSYREERTGRWVVLSAGKNLLTAAIDLREIALTPTSPTTFAAVNTPPAVSLEFLPRSAGRPAAVVKLGENVMRLVRASPLRPLSASGLREYAGDYVSDELLGAVYVLDLGKDGLALRCRSLPRIVLKPMADNQFIAGSFSLDFERGADQKITGFKLSEPGLAGIVFARR